MVPDDVGTSVFLDFPFFFHLLFFFFGFLIILFSMDLVIRGQRFFFLDFNIIPFLFVRSHKMP